MDENTVPVDSAKAVQKLKLAELDQGGQPGRRLLGDNMELIRNVKLRLTVSAGRSELTVKELFELKENAVLALDKSTSDPVDVMLDGRVIARGVLVAVGDNFGVRISELVGR